MRVGLDIGGTKIDAVAVDVAGSVVGQLRMPTRFGPDGVLDSAADAASALAGQLGLTTADFDSVGVGIPGAVDSTVGRVSHAVNLGLDDLELGPLLSARLGAPVRVENDVNAAAVGAFDLLSASGFRSMAYLNLGTGLAAGIVLDGALWRGARGTAGEIGHIPVEPDGSLCQCGQRGCLETLASGSAIARLWPTEPGEPTLFEAADAGDTAAVAVRDRFHGHVAAAVQILVLSVDVDTVVIGGGLSSLGQPLLAGVRSALAASAASSRFIGSLGLSDRVRLMPTGVSAAALGAALVGLRSNGEH